MTDAARLVAIALVVIAKITATEAFRVVTTTMTVATDPRRAVGPLTITHLLVDVMRTPIDATMVLLRTHMSMVVHTTDLHEISLHGMEHMELVRVVVTLGKTTVEAAVTGKFLASSPFWQNPPLRYLDTGPLSIRPVDRTALVVICRN